MSLSATAGDGAASVDGGTAAGVEAALVMLARKGAWLELATGGHAGPRRYAVCLPGAATPLAFVASPAFEALKRGGGIVLQDGGLRWALSGEGRVAVRRLMSRRGEPGAKQARPVAVQLAAASNAPVVDPAESPLGWLRRRTDKDGKPLLSDAQFEAGERLRADLFFAGLGPRVTTNWSAAAVPGGRSAGASGGGVEQSDRAIGARERVNRALAAVGPELSGILIDVCGHLKGLEDVEDARGWAKRSAKVVLDLALTSLARHYGYIGAPAREPPGPAKVRHWGGDGYRPGMGASGE